MSAVREATRFRSEQENRNDQEAQRRREELGREHDRERTEAAERYSDHERRLRTLERVVWGTLGTASLAFITAMASLVIKAFSGN